jgi:acyl carrier protein
MINISEQDAYLKVEQAIRLVLNLQGQGFSPTTTLIGDLGAESIDFLDISCELEKLVGIEVDFRKLLRTKLLMCETGIIDLTLQNIVEYLEGDSQ